LNLPLIIRTLPYLRWEQIVYRPWRQAQFRLYRALPGLTVRWTSADKETPSSPPLTLATFQQVFAQMAHLHAPLTGPTVRWAGLLDGHFTFLNRTLALPQPDWNRRYDSHLWNYQLHYFEFAVWCARQSVEGGDARYWHLCRQWICRWLEQARPGWSDGWDAYPTSLRLVNWIYAYCLLADSEAGTAFQTRWRTSIYQQLDFLSRHLEYHLLANHLLKNAKALVIGGLFFGEDRQAKRWLSLGQHLLWRELVEQVLPDGGHYERTPMYHAQTLGDWLECFALLRAFDRLERGALQFAEQLRKMAEFLAAMSYADGTLALFNDAANTEETRPQPLLKTAARICGYAPDQVVRKFPQTGYFLWATADETEKIIVDGGPPAVAYNTAHAHCDLLSYELRFDAKPFIVDPGVHGYGDDPFREYCRATRAHNTVMFDGSEQSEVWGTFRLARRAEFLAARAEGDAQTWQFQGTYRPYYDRNLTHERLIERRANGEWVISDTAQYRWPSSGAAGVTRAESFIHLHPAVHSVRQVQDDGLVIECQTDMRSILIEPFGAHRVELIWGGTKSPTKPTPPRTPSATARAVQGWYFPNFGQAQPSPVICFHYRVRSGTPFGYIIKTTQLNRPLALEFCAPALP
jgi:uncharacterized heparinase superfamily protein